MALRRRKVAWRPVASETTSMTHAGPHIPASRNQVGTHSPTALLHGLTVDVEDWFHILESADAPQPQTWAQQESRVAYNTMRLLALFDRHQVRATFFCLGWVAEQCADLVREIANRGHEIGSHSHSHQLIDDLGRDGFARDLDRSIEALLKAGASSVKLFRAPGFSLGCGQTWALPVLASRGISIDASMFLAPRAHGGIALQRARPFEIVLADGQRITEVPTVPRKLGNLALPFAGGGYLRLLPWPVLRSCFEASQAAGSPAIVYVHPREIDSNQPRMPLSPLRRFKYYVGLDSTLPKLEKILQNYRFGPLSQVVATTVPDQPVYFSAAGELTTG